MSRILSIIGLLLVTTSYPLLAEDMQSLNQEAKQLIKQFASVLKPALKHAIKTQGPAAAIKVCSEVAPKTAQQLSDSSGWQIKRVSLKARNHASALPDAFETNVLQQFEQRLKAGEDIAKMKYSEITDDGFRFMKPQGTEKVCTMCHGKDIKPEIKQALAEYYPQDKATGYNLGDIRGAFSLQKTLKD